MIYLDCQCKASVDPAEVRCFSSGLRSSIQDMISGCITQLFSLPEPSRGIPLDNRGLTACPDCGQLNSRRLREAKDVTREVENFFENIGLYSPGDGEVELCPASVHRLVSRAESIPHPTNFTLGIFYKEMASIWSDVPNKVAEYMEKMLMAAVYVNTRRKLETADDLQLSDFRDTVGFVTLEIFQLLPFMISKVLS